jgi:hypothetical protein
MSATKGATMRALAAAALAVAVPAAAQQDARAADTAPARASWLARVSVSARVGELRPAGGSEFYALVDRALDAEEGALRPRLVGGALHVRVAGPVSLVVGAEAGGSTLASTSRVRPASSADAVRQRTALDLTAVQYVGAEWQALRWADHLRLTLGAGAGTARYRLRQWGGFVDAERQVAYEDDFRSSGRGTFGFASAAVEVPVRGRLALQGELRRQVGSAPMSADYASFDRLDLGGTRLGLGVRLQLARGRGAR